MDNLKSIIYISKRCPYCRKLLGLLQNRPELKGSIQIVSIDDEPFPKIIKSVPSMVSNGELWNADELFAVLEGRKLDSQSLEQNKQPTEQNTKQPHPGQNTMQPGEKDTGPMLNGYSEDNSSLGYSMLDNTIDNSFYASSDLVDPKISNGGNNGYIPKGQKEEAFDNDYEKMLAERGNIDTEIRN